MKKKLIFLDFTSLLDVIMIILFFFIIFSKIETDEYRQGLEEQQNQVAAQQAQYQEELEAREAEIQLKEDKAAELYEEAAKEKENADIMQAEASLAEERSGENADALSEFNENKNLKICITTDNTNDLYNIRIITIEKNNKTGKDETIVEDISKSPMMTDKNSISSWTLGLSSGDILTVDKETLYSKLSEAFLKVFEIKKYTTEDTILIELFYNSNEAGTTAAEKDVTRVLELIRKEYTHCFYSVTDQSLFE